MAIRAPQNTRRDRRLRDLFRAFAAKLDDPTDVIARAAALRAAELTATAEDIRESIRAIDLKDASADLLKQVGSLADQLVRIENLADRAERRLCGLAQNTPKGPTLSDYLRFDDEDEQHGGEQP